MEEDFKFQREFSSTLLDQMKNVLAQITCLIEILNHLLTDNKLNNKELNLDTITDRILKNICDLQHQYFGKNMKKLPRVLKNVESVLDSLTSFSFGSRNKNETVTEDESVAVLRNCYGTIGNGRMCPLFCHDKNENIYCMSHVESDYIEEPKRIGKITRRYDMSCLQLGFFPLPLTNKYYPGFSTIAQVHFSIE
ncbi:hypothetical protein RUM44_005177 [Polyplax serrata]|uniref:Uncharacterized protein n=1 Tax=Polyplax serrata TaxID=468196 RepID=A0ABR1AE95_POLSC